MEKLLRFYIILALNIFYVNSAFPDGAVYGGKGETIFPLRENGIRMIREEVIAFENNQDLVKCFFVLENLEIRERTIQIGFPFDESYANTFADRNDPKLTPKIFIDDKEIIPQKKEGIDNPTLKLKGNYPLVFAFNVHFMPYERKGIKVEYTRMWSSGDAGPGGSFAVADFKYIVETGALWAGNIQNADFYVYTSHPMLKAKDYMVEIKPGGYTRKDSLIEWHFENWKPDTNLSVHFTFLVSGAFREKMLDAIQSRPYKGDRRLYNRNDLSFNPDVSKEENKELVQTKYLWILRNEIFARHGYKFKSRELCNFFTSFDWYEPQEKFDMNEMSQFELQNIKIISEKEKMLEQKLKKYNFSN